MLTEIFSREPKASRLRSGSSRSGSSRLAFGEQLEQRHAMAVVLSMSGPTAPVAEGQQAEFTLTLSQASTVPQRVTITTAPGTATYGVDYFAPLKQTILFAPGQTTQTFSIATLRDAGGDKVEGKETFTVTATPDDPKLLIFERSQVVTIIDTTGSTTKSGFQITLDYVTTSQGAVPSDVRDACTWAAARWSQVITGDLPNVRLPDGKVVDDIVIHVQMGLLGSAANAAGGVLANAGPISFRSDAKGLPYEADAGVDPFDASSAQLKNILLHEFGHALGFGTLWSSKSLTQTLTANNPTYIGTNAVREYNRIFGTTGTSVPVENGGGVGTAGGHWRESVFDTELMTGYSETAGVAMPLSAITVGAMQDLGYVVNYSKADAYVKPSITAAQQSQGGGTSGVGALSLNQAVAKAFAAMSDETAAAGKPRSATRRPTVA